MPTNQFTFTINIRIETELKQGMRRPHKSENTSKSVGKSVCFFVIVLTWTKAEMTLGSMDKGNRRMLKRERATKAFSASRIFIGSERT